MAKRRRTRTKTFRGKAPWRETRRVDSSIDGGECIPGLGAECTEEILGTHFVFPAPNLPCFTVLVYPLLSKADWQNLDATGNASWKERVVHTHTNLEVEVQPNPLWLAQVSRNYQVEIQTDTPASVLIAPFRSALVIYDDDETLNPVGIPSLFSNGWQETERYIPGTFRQGRIYHQSSVVEIQPIPRVKVSTSARRRLETGEGLYWQFEMGCVTANDASGDIANDLFTAYGGPFWLLGQASSTYIE